MAAPTRLAPPVIRTTFPCTPSFPSVRVDFGAQLANLAQRPGAVPKPLSPGLPAPDADAAAHSARVLASVRDAIAAAGGWIPFSDYMQHVLYAPGLGYYTAGAR